jgi:hypothetical protein
VEAGTNDIVVLPILLVLIAIAHVRRYSSTAWASRPRRCKGA